MADVAKKMYTGQPSNTDTLLYTAPSTGAVVRSIHIANTSANAVYIHLGLNAGATLAVANHFISHLSIPAYGTYDWTGFAMLDANGTIRAQAETTGALTVSISGVEL